MARDQPANNSIVLPGFTVSGWAIDRGSGGGTGIAAVHVYAYPASGAPPIFLGSATLGDLRPDVAAIFGPAFQSSGFHLTTPAIAPGGYRIVAFALSTVSGTFAIARVADVTVQSGSRMVLDTPGGGTVAQPLLVAGWALDLARPQEPVSTPCTSTRIRIPVPVPRRSFWASRATAIHALTSHSSSAPGSRTSDSRSRSRGSRRAYLTVTFAHSTVTTAFDARAVVVTIASGQRMAVDIPRQTRPSDRRSPSRVRSMPPRRQGPASSIDTSGLSRPPDRRSSSARPPMAGARPDVAAFFDRFQNTAFSLSRRPRGRQLHARRVRAKHGHRSLHGTRSPDDHEVKSLECSGRSPAADCPLPTADCDRRLPAADCACPRDIVRSCASASMPELHDFGIGTYIRNLLRHLARLDPTSEYVLVCRPQDTGIAPMLGPNVRAVSEAARPYSVREQYRLPYDVRRACLDVFHAPHYVLPVLTPGRSVVTIHDCIHLMFPQYLRQRLAHSYARTSMWIATHRASRILTVSDASKRDILRFFPIPADKISVIYNAIDERFAVPPREEEVARVVGGMVVAATTVG
jgi:hypothetical protein